MAVMRVNPTRMELKRLKERLKTAVRGHKLLKDKTDEMVRRFVVIAKQNKDLREQVEAELGDALRTFMYAKAMTETVVAEEALMMPARVVSLSCSKKTLMNVPIPVIEISEKGKDIYPYSFLTVTSEMDSSVSVMNQLLTKLIKLAEVEKTTNMLADEIEKNKRRVNALENVLIPQTKETIKYIKMKLDENERASIVRLMKVKTIIENR
ncbi:MAG TPA: V-type ATP synthase subunit D [Eubacteriales bacterium]|nr:V-type ATP synthase subunit D [Eubacteriales bacterium]